MNKISGTAVLTGITAGVTAAAMAGVEAVRRIGSPHAAEGNRWRVVTVNRAPHEVTPEGRFPEPLEELREHIDVEIRPAPGDRGTEIAARLREPEPTGVAGAAARIMGDDPRQTLRTALRHSKQLLETGEILRAHEPRTAHPGPAGKVVAAADRRAGGEGRL